MDGFALLPGEPPKMKGNDVANTHEQWDIVSSVGYTALAVAAGRAAETQREDRLVNDPHANALVQAASSDLPEGSPLNATSDGDFVSSYLGVRSRYFDEFFDGAGKAGIRQVVILASGLDTRPQRLDWPEGTVVFEIDQPLVLKFKERVLGEQGATTSCQHRPIQVDLRDDWPTALLEAGFDRTEPTAWLAEGLLPYLPAEAEAQLLRTIHDFSTPGSRASLECTNDREKITTGRGGQMTRDVGIDLTQLFSFEPRPEPDDELTGYGWKVQRDRSDQVAESYGRPLAEFERELSDNQYFLTGSLPE
jgi:methyltransferase (TIGR00027 family)